MDKETIKLLKLFVGQTAQMMMIATLRNRAYEMLAPESRNQVTSLLTTSEFVALEQESLVIRERLVAAVGDENWAEFAQLFLELQATLARR